MLLVVLGGFIFGYFYNFLMFNQTKSKLESLGFTISNNVQGVDISTFIEAGSVVRMVDLNSFVILARQYNSTTIYEQGASFYVILTLLFIVTAYQYTPSNYVWWFFSIE